MSLGTPALNLHAPGPIGDVTPATIAGTTLTINSPASGVGSTWNSPDVAVFNIVAANSDFVIQYNGVTQFELQGFAFYPHNNDFRYLWNGPSPRASYARYTLPGDNASGIGDGGGTHEVSIVVNSVDTVTVTSSTLALKSGLVLQLGNAATTGLTPGVLAATTNASIVLTDNNGQAYRIPCII